MLFSIIKKVFGEEAAIAITSFIVGPSFNNLIILTAIAVRIVIIVLVAVFLIKGIKYFSKKNKE